MSITFSTLNNGARSAAPYVHATVDGVRIRFVDRRPEHVGWRCDEHGDITDCEHSEALYPFFGRRMSDRIDYLIERNEEWSRA